MKKSLSSNKVKKLPLKPLIYKGLELGNYWVGVRKSLETLSRILKNFFNVIAIVVFTVGCTSMDPGVPFPNDELQETSTSSHSFVPFTTQTYQYDLEGVETTVTYGQGE